MYINEIIRINYLCNWKCSFCNVSKVNNFGEKDIDNKEVVYKILALTKNYNKDERRELTLSFSGGEPTLNKNLVHYIALAKKIWIWKIQIQTNGSLLFKNNKLYQDLIEAGLNEIFLAQHTHNDKTNKELGCFYKFEDFLDWIEFLKKQSYLPDIFLNIVVTQKNIWEIEDFISILIKKDFLKLLRNKISLWFCQPMWYAMQNKETMLLDFNNIQKISIEKIIELSRKQNVLLDFHYTSPPLCVLNYPEYNLEYNQLKQLEIDNKKNNISESNLESFKFLWKEKTKYSGCNKCSYNKYCLGFYKNYEEYLGKNKIEEFISDFTNNAK